VIEYCEYCAAKPLAGSKFCDQHIAQPCSVLTCEHLQYHQSLCLGHLLEYERSVAPSKSIFVKVKWPTVVEWLAQRTTSKENSNATA
jgi:hypothetical protein